MGRPLHRPSADVIAEYRDPRVRYFLSPGDTALGPARQFAMQQARGEWLAFLDQDDLWLPHKLERQLALAAPGVGLIYGRTVRFYPGGMERDYDQAHEFQMLPEGRIFERLFTESCFIAMSSAMFRRTAIEEIGGIPEEVRIIPDYYLYVAVAERYEARAVQQVVARYRMHAGSMSQTYALEMHREVLWLIDRWADRLPPETVALCRRRHQTAIALEEMRRPASLARGMGRLLTQGSPWSQLERPLLFAFHLARRNLRQPLWRALGDASPVSDAEIATSPKR